MRPAAWLLIAVLSGCTASGATMRPGTGGGSDLAAPEPTALPPPSSQTFVPGGAIEIHSVRYVMNGNATANTGIIEEFERTTAAPCTAVSTGSCTLTSCPRLLPTDGGWSPTPSPTAGALTVSGGKSPVTLTPDSSGLYPQYMTRVAMWSGGETIGIEAAGADVPQFSVTLPAPRSVTLTSPAWPDGGPMSVARDHDVVLAWDGDTDGYVGVKLVVEASSFVTLDCQFVPSAHRAVIPAAVLAQLPTGDGALLVFSRSERVVDSGDWKIDALLFTLAVDPRQLLASYNVSLR